MILISFQEDRIWWFACIWLIPAFSILYFTTMTYYYLLRGDEKFEIKGVDIQVFKWPVKIYLLISLIGLIIGFILFIKLDSVLASAMFLTFYNGICAVVLKLVIYAKFFSLAIKKNPTLKDLKIEDLYTDVREILLKKVIS